MVNKSTVVWMHPGFEERERDLQAKGYAIQRIQSGIRPRLYDEVPDMVIYAEELLSENSLFFKINQFFPDTVALSIGTGSATHDVQESRLNASMNKLIEDIKAIDLEE